MPSKEDVERAMNAARLREAIPKVHEYVVKLLDETAESQLSPIQATVRGLLDRVACWLTTLNALNSSDHYQAHVAGLRAMIELSVDIALLHLDPTMNDQLEAWELSAKYKHAETFLAYAQSHKTNFSKPVAQSFVTQNQTAVEADRARYWPNARGKGKPGHPMRWTGQTLRVDVQHVDTQFPGLGLEKLYEEMYPIACSMVHGSALAGMRGATGTDLLSVITITMQATAHLGLGCAELAMRCLGLFSSSRQRELQDARNAWLLAFAKVTVCPKCQEMNPDSAKACARCGASLTGSV